MCTANGQHWNSNHSQRQHCGSKCYRWLAQCVLFQLPPNIPFLTGNNDYVPLTAEVEFISDGPREHCLEIDIIDDTFLEDTEFFQVHIESSVSSRVTLAPSMVDIFINGTEGNILYSVCVHMITS